jgi:hypothetical protein
MPMNACTLLVTMDAPSCFWPQKWQVHSRQLQFAFVIAQDQRQKSLLHSIVQAWRWHVTDSQVLAYQVRTQPNVIYAVRTSWPDIYRLMIPVCFAFTVCGLQAFVHASMSFVYRCNPSMCPWGSLCVSPTFLRNAVFFVFCFQDNGSSASKRSPCFRIHTH